MHRSMYILVAEVYVKVAVMKYIFQTEVLIDFNIILHIIFYVFITRQILILFFISLQFI
jgi:hypothetical protein